MTITYAVPQSRTVNLQRADNPLVTDVLADASGGSDVPAGASTGCSDSTSVAAENTDDDLFFCAARGDDMAPLFITALTKVSKGIRLIKLP